MDLYKLNNNKLEPVENQSFRLEKDIQTLIENNVEKIFSLEFITTEFSINEFRLDSLCYDNDTNSFVIIEYKKGSSYSVIDQGYSYMSVMLNNKSDFILEYNERKNKSLKRDEVDWSQSRIIFISPSFNTYQKNSVNFKDVPFELWEIKKFSNDLISLNKHESSSNESISKVEGGKNTIIKNVNKQVGAYDEDYHINKINKSTLPLWKSLKQKLLEFDNVDLKFTKQYIGLVFEQKNSCSIILRKTKIDVIINRGIEYTDGTKSKTFFELDDPKSISKPLSWTWKNGTKGHTYSINYDNNSDLDYIIFLIKQKYDSILN